jgi:TatD DNase family protein
MAMLIDTHAHLTDPRFGGDLDAVLKRAGEAGVEAILDVGDSDANSAACIGHARSCAGVFAAVGIHPNNAAKAEPEDLERIGERALDGRVAALGETGLDYYRRHAPRELQMRLFRGTLELALETDLPVVMHCRDAYADLIGVLGEARFAGIRGVVHCFSGTGSDAGAIIGLGYYLSVGGPLTYPANAGLRETMCAAPLDRILVETDCPYLPPEGERGKRNEPALVARVAEELARLRGVSPGEIARITTENALRLFTRMGAAMRNGEPGNRMQYRAMKERQG